MPCINKKIKIGISDESLFIVYSVQSILSKEFSDMETSFYPTDAENLLRQLKDKPVDILIADFRFTFDKNHTDNFSKIEAIRIAFPALRIAIFTNQTESVILEKLADIAVDAIVSKKDCHQQLTEAIARLATGTRELYLSKKIKATLSGFESASAYEILSPSELEIIRLYAMGHTLNNIAKMRKRSVSTIATQKYNAMRKLKVQSNTDLIKYVFTQRLM